MRLILDASVAAAWAFDEESQPLAAHALQLVRASGAIAPAIFWYEVRDVLLVNERRGRLSLQQTALYLDNIAQLSIMIDDRRPETWAFALARLHRLTFYDAAYLELAQRLELPLATLDGELARAARREKIPLLTA